MIKDSKNFDCKYKFVVIASQRSEQLVDGARQKIESFSNKPTIVAQQEVLAGLVDYYHEDENPPDEEEGDKAKE